MHNKKYPAIYCSIYPMLVDVARECGYGLAIHGSMANDFDLIAIPWTKEAKSDQELIDAVLNSFEGSFISVLGDIGIKPHGRKVWTIILDGHCYLDFGIMPLVD